MVEYSKPAGLHIYSIIKITSRLPIEFRTNGNCYMVCLLSTVIMMLAWLLPDELKIRFLINHRELRMYFSLLFAKLNHNMRYIFQIKYKKTHCIVLYYSFIQKRTNSNQSRLCADKQNRR
jgi:hypothetical protein